MIRSLLFILCFFPTLRESFAASRPSIVFIEVDDLTYTYTGTFGSKSVLTPNLDKLASESYIFDQAMCQGMMCGPSRNCLISGKYPHQIGFYQNGNLRKLPEGGWVLPAALRKAGYFTAWIGKSHLKPYFSGRKKDTFAEYFGFDHALHTLGRALVGGDDGQGEGGGEDDGTNPYTRHLIDRGLIEQYTADAAAKRNSTLPEDSYLDGWFTRNTEDFLASYSTGKPLFLWINYSVPHGPYDVADKYHVPFETAAMPGVSRPTNFTHPGSLIERTKSFRSGEQAIRDQRGFCSNIFFMDEQLRRVREALDSRGMLETSWIVFFSDHGIMQGAHNLIHKHTLFRQVTQPTLMIRPPGGVGGGKHIAQPVELMDLLPTALELADADPAHAPSGVSLTPIFEGRATARQYSFGEIEKWIVVSDGHYRLIRSVGGEPSLLFDDLADPENLTNIAAENSGVMERLSDAIDQWLKQTGERLPPKSF